MEGVEPTSLVALQAMGCNVRFAERRSLPRGGRWGLTHRRRLTLACFCLPPQLDDSYLRR